MFSLCLLCIGCSKPVQRHWGKWSDWSEWTKTDKKENHLLKVTSDPGNAKVYFGKSFKGKTPTTVKLSYPVLQSERKKYLYEDGKIVNTAKSNREQLGEVDYKIIVKLAGYRTSSKSVGRNLSTVHFILKKKVCIKFRTINIVNNIELSSAQKTYDFIFRKKYSKDLEPEELVSYIKSNNYLNELYSQTNGGNCDSLDCHLTINNNETVLILRIFDSQGKSVYGESSKFKTDFEREHFLNSLRQEIGLLLKRIYKSRSGD